MRDQQYRRKEDEDTKLLILLNEKISNLIETIATKNEYFEKVVRELEERQKGRLDNINSLVSMIGQKQNDNPCKTHNLRIKYLERIMYLVGSPVFLLSVKAIFSFFSSAP